jgi:signal transduction histidine kinase
MLGIAMPRPLNRSISVPIVLSVIAVLLTVAMLVGWIWVLQENLSLTRALWANRWLLAGGIVSLAVIVSVLVLFSVSLVREILEGRRQQTFIDSVTHELKSPLASIKLCLDTLPRGGLSAPQREELRQMMLNDVERLTVFVDDILEASRIAHGLRSQLWTVVRISALLESAADSIRRRYNLAADDIVLCVPADIELTTDPTALETIFKNILDNAVKYSPLPPQVQVDSRPASSGRLEISVRDNGIGIERAQLKRIFKRFHRVPSAAVNERSGTGLGLYVVAQLLRNLGGTVRAESAGNNQGTTVIIRLPLGVSTVEATGI